MAKQSSSIRPDRVGEKRCPVGGFRLQTTGVSRQESQGTLSMLETTEFSPRHESPLRVGVISTFPPTRCGIGRFGASLVAALRRVDPTLDVEVLRLLPGTRAPVSTGPVVMEIDPDDSVGIRAAARRLDECDVTVIQHEFGIYGANDGEAVLDLVAAVESPKLVALHTVLPDPTERQRSIVETLAGTSRMVVLCRSAADLLRTRYTVPRDAIEIIPHGSNWSAQPVNPPPRRQLITWGLLGPGKGLERSLEAVALLRDIDPPIRYRLVGRTHPVVAERHGYAYRRMLERRVTELELSNVVEFVERYVDDDELFQLVKGSDVVVVPYDNRDQVSSGVITEAVGMGRPVVATNFPYSEEVLAKGAGIVVDHDPHAIADAIRALVDDPIAYRRAAREAARLSEELSWESVAHEYSRLIQGLAPAAATG